MTDAAAFSIAGFLRGCGRLFRPYLRLGLSLMVVYAMTAAAYLAFIVYGYQAAGGGVLFVGPELGRIDRAAQQFGPESAEVGRRVARLFTIFRLDTALLVLIVLDMAAKPSF